MALHATLATLAPHCAQPAPLRIREEVVQLPAFWKMQGSRSPPVAFLFILSLPHVEGGGRLGPAKARGKRAIFWLQTRAVMLHADRLSACGIHLSSPHLVASGLLTAALSLVLNYPDLSLTRPC